MPAGFVPSHHAQTSNLDRARIGTDHRLMRDAIRALWDSAGAENRHLRPVEYLLTVPSSEELANGSAEWLEKNAQLCVDLIRLVQQRAERDADLFAGPLLALLRFTDQPIARAQIQDYVFRIGDSDAPRAYELMATHEMTWMMLKDARSAQAAQWPAILRQFRLTVRES